jgi:1-acyl-sn-glycerol-3-phosphate acyltransferase
VTTPVPPAPTPADVAPLLRLLGPVRTLIQPVVSGIDQIPGTRALLVGNHSVLGLIDAPLLVAELWERGLMVRALGDHAHFAIPLWRDAMLRCGVIDGTRAATATLMERDELIMVFPGGGREVAKRRGERYQLVWKQRMGFARLAIENGYPIVPFASVGAEHGVDILLDADSWLLAPARALLTALTGSSDLPPLVRGMGLTPIPRPERQYFHFGTPIDTREFGGIADDRDVRRIRDRTARAIEAGIETLLEVRAADPGRGLLPRLRSAVLPGGT